MLEENTNLASIVRETEQNFISGTGTLMSKYVRTDMYEDINKIYAYLSSKHVSGETDSQGREKPFFNIVTAARNIRYRATDIDRRNIKIKATKSTDIFGSFLATVKLQEWMRKSDFGTFLNSWGLELASFNDVVVKFVEKDGELKPSVIPWSRIICDQVNFADNLKIEIIEMTEDQLYNSGYPKDKIDTLIDGYKARELTNKQKKDNKNNYFKLYEVHGVLPLSYKTGKEEDKDNYVQQMHVLSFVGNKKSDKGYDEYTLYSGLEKKDPYMLTSLVPETDGSIGLNGVVKDLFEAQWMVNHTKKQIKDQLDLASMLIFQTSDGNFIGQNALDSILTGDIMIHAVNQPITQVQNNSHDITALQNFGGEWKAVGNEIVGVSESMYGNSAPSGTAWRQVEALLNESHSLFELMTENKGLCIERMMREFIIPHIKKKMDTAEEIGAILDGYQLQKIDTKYVPAEATKRLSKKLINQIIATGDVPEVTGGMVQAEVDGVKEELDMQGNQRFFKPDDIEDVTWKQVFDKLEWELEVDVTGEQSDNKSDMATLSTLFQTVVSKQGQPFTPEEKMVFDKILVKSNTVSPIELTTIPTQAKTAPQSPPTGEMGATL
jgi:hypothetical protein